MKTDWDDAPIHIWQKKNSNRQIGLGLVVGCVLSAGVIFIGSKIIPKESDRAEAVITPYVPKYEFIEAPESTGPTPEERFWSDIEQRRDTKQTEFNDSNYLPKGAINSVSYEPQTTQKSEARGTRTSKNVEHEDRWIKAWDGGSSYYAKWTVANNYIDGSSVCANQKRGSIEKRECRKGAKQFFKEQCRAWDARYESDREGRNQRMKQRYCSAANSFNPMG